LRERLKDIKMGSVREKASGSLVPLLRKKIKSDLFHEEVGEIWDHSGQLWDPSDNNQR
jgi:hypothetical protein